MGTSEICGTGKDLGKDEVSHFRKGSCVMSWSSTSLACFTCCWCYMPNRAIRNIKILESVTWITSAVDGRVMCSYLYWIFCCCGTASDKFASVWPCGQLFAAHTTRYLGLVWYFFVSHNNNARPWFSLVVVY